MVTERILYSIEQKKERLADLADNIWANPELGLHETHAADLLTKILREEGFDVKTGIGGMPTAFIASYGDNDPKIGILGEYDALPGLSQKSVPEHEPVEEGAPGHGCGHNLFAVGSLGGALGVKDAIDAKDIEGTIYYFGCPAEETLIGKVFMAREGAFDDMDAVLGWHPSDITTPWEGKSLALDSIQFSFKGTSAHASSSPESGRSSLDSVQLLNTGIEYMREHISNDARVHYIITEGGDAPNVIPASATVWIYIRAPTRSEVERLSQWVTEIAEGAALMTQTNVKKHYLTGCYSYLSNNTISDVLWENMRELGPIQFTEEDEQFASDLQETIDEAAINARIEETPIDIQPDVQRQSLYSNPVTAFDSDEVSGGSTDVGDVSWIAPTGQFKATAFPVGTPGHSWQIVAANAAFGNKGALYAAKVLGTSAADLMNNPETLEQAWTEFKTQTEGKAYQNPLNEDSAPPKDII